jgi:hypothetical protein
MPIDSILRKDTLSTKDLIGSSQEAKALRERPEGEVGGGIISNPVHANNAMRLLLVIFMALAAIFAISVVSYKYLNVGFHCIENKSQPESKSSSTKTSDKREEKDVFINCPSGGYTQESQKEAGSMLHSLVSSLFGLVAGLGIGAYSSTKENSNAQQGQ